MYELHTLTGGTHGWQVDAWYEGTMRWLTARRKVVA